MHHQFSTASAKALSTLNSLTELILWRADEPDVVEEPTQQVLAPSLLSCIRQGVTHSRLAQACD